MKIFPNVYEIKSVFGNRYIYQYLFVGEITILLDTGVATTPNSVIFPYLEKIGMSPRQLTMVIAMHADVDHHGGLPAIKNANAGALLACHREDLQLIEDPEFLYQRRYNFLAHNHGLGFGREGMVHCPEGRKIDLALAAGETLQLAKDWKLQVWHVPGHSAGHLAIYDEKNRAAFTSDAVQANGYPTIDGKLAFGPTYYTIDSYLATIQFLEKWPIEHIFSGHWPALHGKEVRAFLDESRKFVLTTDSLLQAYFKGHHGGITLKQILTDLGPKLGDWPTETVAFLQFALYGHLIRLQQQGVVHHDNSQPVQWSLV